MGDKIAIGMIYKRYVYANNEGSIHEFFLSWNHYIFSWTSTSCLAYLGSVSCTDVKLHILIE